MSNNEKISGIYKWINKIDGKYYVGSSRDILGNNGRKYHHNYMLKNNKHHNIHFQRAWNKYGEENFDFVVIESRPNIGESDLLAIEQKYLDIAKTEKDKCYNRSFIAGRIEMTQEVRDKISKKSKERLANKQNHHMFGKHHSEETRRKIGSSNLGKKHTEESKRKISLGHIGINTGPRPQFSGENNPNHNVTIFKLKNTKTNEIFEGTQLQFYTKYKINRGGINAVLYGRCLTISKWWILIAIDNMEYKSTVKPIYDTNIYTFENVKTKDSFVGLLKDFCKTHNLDNVHKLTKGKQKFVGRWILTHINGIPFTCNLSKFNTKIYRFDNVHTRETFVGLIKDFTKKYELNPGQVSQLINQKTKHCKGWILISIDGDTVNVRAFRPAFDPTIYTFHNTNTKESFKGLRQNFTKKYSLDRHYITKLIRKQIPTVKGWVITKINQNGQNL